MDSNENLMNSSALHKTLIIFGLLLYGCVPAFEGSENISDESYERVSFHTHSSGLKYQSEVLRQNAQRTPVTTERNLKTDLINPQQFAPTLIDYEDVEIFAVNDPCFGWLAASPEERANMPVELIEECEERFMEYVHAYRDHGDPTPLKGDEDPVDHGDPTPLSTDPNDDPAAHGDPTPLDGGGNTQ